MSDRRRLGLQVSQGEEKFDELLAALCSQRNTMEDPDYGASLPPARSTTEDCYDVGSLRQKIRAGHILLTSELMHLEAVSQQDAHRHIQSPSAVGVMDISSPQQQPQNAFTRLSQQKNPHNPSRHSRSRHARSPGPAYYQPEIWSGPPVTRSRNKYGASDRLRSSIPASSSADAVANGSPLSAQVRAENARMQARLSSTTSATDCLMDTELAALRRGEMASALRARKAREAVTLAARNEELRVRLREICAATGESPALRLHRMQTGHVVGRTRSPAGEPRSSAMPWHVGAPRGPGSHDHASRSARSTCRSSEPSDERSLGRGEHDAWLRDNADARQRLQAYAKQHAPK